MPPLKIKPLIKRYQKEQKCNKLQQLKQIKDLGNFLASLFEATAFHRSLSLTSLLIAERKNSASTFQILFKLHQQYRIAD